MKFNHLPAFEKHVKSADPDHLSRVYLIVDSEEYVQKKLAKTLVQKDEEWSTYYADELTPQKVDEILNSFSMFSPKRCIAILSIEKLPKNLLKMFLDYLKAPHESLRLVLTSSSMLKSFLPFVKEGVAVDLSSEKPWDKEKRLSDEVMNKFRGAKLKSTKLLCDQVVKMCGLKVSLIDQEVEKLLCYLHGKSEVSKEDLKLVLSNPEHSIFKVGQALFEHRLREALNYVKEQDFPLMMLVYSLRSMIVRSYRLKRVPSSEISQKFPQLKGYLLEKTQSLSNAYSEGQFKKMLQVLFDVELLMKSQPLSEEFLISLLLIKLGGITS